MHMCCSLMVHDSWWPAPLHAAAKKRWPCGPPLLCACLARGRRAAQTPLHRQRKCEKQFRGSLTGVEPKAQGSN